MTIAAGTIWEVRSTGSDNNGGGFVSGASGSDYSQQASAQYSASDLVVDASTNTIVTSATHNFVGADVGNLLHITSGAGWTAGFYQIVSVASNAATLDRSPAATSTTGGSYSVGGALVTLSTVNSNLVEGNTIYVQGATYAETLTLATAVTTNGVIIRWIGYNSSRGDTPTDAQRPYIDGANTRTNCIVVNGKAGHIFKNFKIGRATGAGVLSTSSNGSSFENCRITANGGNGLTSIDFNYLVNCEIDSNTSIGLSGAGSSFMFGVYCHDNGGVGMSVGGSTPCVACISDTNAGDAFTNSGSDISFINCIAYNNTGSGSDGFSFSATGAAPRVWITNNIAFSNGQYGFNRTSTSVRTPYFNYNCYNANSTAGTNNITGGANDVLSDPLLANPASGDFSLQASSPCLASTAFNNLSNGLPSKTYDWNIGVDQADKRWVWGAGTVTQGTGAEAHGGSGSYAIMDPLSTTQNLGWRFLIPCTQDVSMVITFYVKKDSSGANCTLTFSASGSGISAIVDDSVSLSSTYVQYTSSSVSPTSTGFIEVTLKAKDGSTTGNVHVDDVSFA